MANLLYHLSGLNQINSCDVEFGSLQHFACKVSELYPIPTRYYVRAVGRNYILFLFSFWSGRFMDNIQLSHQLLNSFCNSLKLNLGKVRGSILKLFLTSLSDKAPLWFPSVLTLNHVSTIRVSDGELVQSTVKNSLLDSAMISTYSLETFVTVTSFSSFLEILT